MVEHPEGAGPADGDTAEDPHATPTTREELVRQLGEAGRRLSTAAVMYHGVLSATRGLSTTEEKALDLLERLGPLTAGELGEHSGLAPASVTGLVTRLEQKGFVRRTPHPTDRRRVVIEMHREQVAEFEPLFADFVQSMEELYAEFTDEQLAVILRFLTEAARRQHEATTRLASP